MRRGLSSLAATCSSRPTRVCGPTTPLLRDSRRSILKNLRNLYTLVRDGLGRLWLGGKNGVGDGRGGRKKLLKRSIASPGSGVMKCALAPDPHHKGRGHRGTGFAWCGVRSASPNHEQGGLRALGGGCPLRSLRDDAVVALVAILPWLRPATRGRKRRDRPALRNAEHRRSS